MEITNEYLAEQIIDKIHRYIKSYNLHMLTRNVSTESKETCFITEGYISGLEMALRELGYISECVYDKNRFIDLYQISKPKIIFEYKKGE